jgi:tRNA A37 threonylcarbamoyladenosine modification protein TsaB
VSVPLDALAVSAFESLDVPDARLGCWMDAARGEVFAALYDLKQRAGALAELSVVTPPEAAPPEVVWSSWAPWLEPGIVLAGDGASRYAAGLTSGTRVLPHPMLAPTLARLARRALAEGADGAPHQLQPLYVRRPDVRQV